MDKKTIKKTIIKHILYSFASIFLPLILITASAYLLDRLFNTESTIFFVGLLIAFIVIVILLIKRINKINNMMEKHRQEIIKEKINQIKPDPKEK